MTRAITLIWIFLFVYQTCLQILVRGREGNKKYSVAFEIHGEWMFGGKRRVRKALIYPGTKWCGSGNIASNYDDLGEERDTDMCCREHDFCPEYIEAGQSKYGLTNTASYTRLHCPCDQVFYRCLKNNVAKNNKSSSNVVGYIYFDKIKTQCYAKDHPIVGCKEYINGSNRCRTYLYDETQDPVWQWYDVPSFAEE